MRRGKVWRAKRNSDIIIEAQKNIQGELMNRILKGAFLGVTLGAFSLALWAEPQAKVVEDRPDASQTASLPAASYPKTTQSEGVDAELVRSWGRQSSYFIYRNFEILTWDEVKKILMSGKVTGGKQYHTGWTVFFTEDDRYILTKPPHLDDPLVFMKEKGISIDNFTTE
ncbi:MAG: hypothetical protein Kow0029_13120 [Candidatus Rifleibacteriota bacterium]